MSLEFKRSYPIILLLIAVLAIFTFGMGSQRIIAYNIEKDATSYSQTTSRFDISNNTDLFDISIAHSIQVIMDDAQYDQMLTTYQETGLKEYFQVDVIIDGVRINDVGIRLKGNASLSTALGRPMDAGGNGGNAAGNFPQDMPNRGDGNFPGGDGNFQMPQDGQQPEFPQDGQLPEDGQQPQMPGNGEDFVPQENGGFGGRQQGMPNSFSQSSGETKIPFMIKFDAFVEGQTYQGRSAIAIRTYGISYNEAMLQEPVTNEAARLVGLPATQTAYTGFRFNDDDETLYVISELVNDEYLTEYFENDNGVLYKAELGSTLSYEGEDPSSYAESFTQQTRVNDADLAPLIEFIRFINQADDETFANELPNYLDVDAFATYLAFNVLLVNTDSLIGMNNNYYLYYDDVDGRFTLLMWDTNESLGDLGGSATYDISLTNTQNNSDQRAGGGGGRGIGGGENTLIERFMSVPSFEALYREKLQMVYDTAFASGAITEITERYAAVVRGVNDERSLADLTAYDQAVENVLSFIDQRTEYLSSLELLSQ